MLQQKVVQHNVNCSSRGVTSLTFTIKWISSSETEKQCELLGSCTVITTELVATLGVHKHFQISEPHRCGCEPACPSPLRCGSAPEADTEVDTEAGTAACTEAAAGSEAEVWPLRATA